MFSINYHLTSIFDATIYESFSKVIQKVFPQVSQIENLLELLQNNNKFEKTFLFDVIHKLCLATDSVSFDISKFTMCSDMIDVFIDISFIYGQNQNSLMGDNQS